MIVIDIETTGIDPQKNSIVSIGAVDLFNPENYFYRECKIWKGAEINDKALEINGFTKGEITRSHKKTLKEILLEFEEWMRRIDDKTLAGHNLGGLDIPFLLDSFKRYNFSNRHFAEGDFGKRNVDLHTLAYSSLFERGMNIPLLNGRSAINLNYALNYVGLPNEPEPHNALTGAKMEAEAIFRLISGGHKLMKEFVPYKIPSDLKNYLSKK